MADQFDRASDLEALNLQSALYLQQRRALSQPKITATGECLYCGEPVEGNTRWCSVTCRDDWQAENPHA